ncbi:MAG TPA: site-2 protease family protein [Blastocatellia bacterium]|nr:site-2 protease family protein [Blastocatellia bacterium]
MSQPYYFPPQPPDPYRPTVIHPLPVFEPEPPPRSEKGEITPGRVLVHLLLLGLTALTTTIIGSLLFVSITSGLLFSFTLLGILGAHEMGHYIACQWYGVRATLPYFIPAPVGIGTFGAFIKIKSPIPNKKALFDIGIAGPLAGFVFVIPAALVALYFAEPAAPGPVSEGTMLFNDPLLFRLFERLLHVPGDLNASPVYLAAWFGMLVTSLNLLPVGQLDGGHVAYAVFGGRRHRLIARAIYLCVVGMAVFALTGRGWMGWVIYAVLLTLMLRVGHPPIMDEYEPLGLERKIVAFIGLMVFLLCFNPFPITFI